MSVDTTVKFLHSGLPGAPVLSGTAGALIALLDACLVNGFSVASVSSLTVASGVATATVSAGHAAEIGSVVEILGATPSGLNGQKKCISIGGGNTTLTFDATGISDQTATGSITLKLAGAGWTKAFAGTNLAAYKSPNVAASGCYLRIDDTGTKVARAVGYESMTSISAGTGPFPTTAQRSGGTYWTKSSAADATGRAWTFAGDDRGFMLAIAYSLSLPLGGALTAFGDLLPAKSGDAWACVVSGYASDKSASAPGDTNDLGVLRAAADELYLPRSHTALGSAVQAYKAFSLIAPAVTTGFASGNGPLQYPNGPDAGLYFTDLMVFEPFQNCLRGRWPGLHCCPQGLPFGLFQPNARLPAVENLLGRELRAVTFGAGTGTNGTVFVDTTGPWRS